MKTKTLTLILLCLATTSAFAQKTDTIPPKGPEFVFTTVLSNPITSVKNQNRSSTCWSFSTIGFLESELLRMGKGEYDLSEMFVVHHTMLDRAAYCARFREAAGRDIIDSLDWEEVRGIAGTFLSMGAKVVLLKLGACWMYLRTADEAALAQGGRALQDCAKDWSGRELWIFPNTVERIVSTTGAGDVGIAGFLATLLRGGGPVQALKTAATAASLCIQSADSTSLLLPWEEVAALGEGAQRTVKCPLPADCWRAMEPGLFRGGLDRDF